MVSLDSNRRTLDGDWHVRRCRRHKTYLHMPDHTRLALHYKVGAMNADVFDAMKDHVDAITEHLTAIEISEKAGIDLVNARDWNEACHAAKIAMRNKREDTERALCSVINEARKATPKIGD